MKRLLICLTLLTTILAAGIFSAAYVRNTNARIQDLCAEIREQVISDTDPSSAITELCTCWQEHCKILSFLENFNSVTAISAEMSRLPALASADPADLIEQIDSISEQCRLLSQRHLPSLHSLL
ncbi:DUF4363 family protein [Ruminococcus albus]|uniref:DUF4363 domain-containing protein n=1 Tax=Ruminococcus albus TaxID=1264 RepID=A0A1I1LK87_RUMAL|nr:DUF4363 family protein [Ruminococcus albus]SFC72982.1 protein of unknown function [Ruminococcus albus]